MNSVLKKVAFFVGLGILGISIFWSQDGFNFGIAGESGYTEMAKGIAWFLAISVSLLQFVFSSNFRELNLSLLVLGGCAYTYSIYTNYQGITHFQGNDPAKMWASVLAFMVDATAEPLIAWSVGMSREGDFLGNILKVLSAAPDYFIKAERASKSPVSQKPMEFPRNQARPVGFGGKRGESSPTKPNQPPFRTINSDTDEAPNRFNLK